MTRVEPRPAAGAMNWRWWTALVAVLVVAAGLRVYRIGAEGFWIDELYSLEHSAGNGHADFELPPDRVLESPPRLTRLDSGTPAWKIPTTLKDDPHPPLYYVLLRLWREAFGSSEVALRSLSAVASLAAIILLFDVGRLLFSPGVALWACAIMAVAQADIRYAQEARSYALLTALMLAAADALVRIERHGFSIRRGMALGAAMCAVVLTHYYGVAGCVALGAYALIRLRGKARARALGVMVIAAVTYVVAWGPFFLQQMHGHSVQSNWLALEAEDLGSPLWAWTRRLLNAPIRLFAEPSLRNPGPLPMVAAAVLVLPLLRVRRMPALLLPALWMIAWFGLVGGLDLLRSMRQMEFIRYLLGAAPAVYLCVAALLWDRRGWVRHLVPAVFVLYCITSLPWTYDVTRAEWRRLGQDIGKQATSDDLVLYYTASGRDWFSGVMYLAVDYYSPQGRIPSVIVTRPLAPDVLARAQSARAVWLATDSPDIPRLVPGFRAEWISLCWGVGYVAKLVPTVPPPPPAGTGTSSTPTVPGT